MELFEIGHELSCVLTRDELSDLPPRAGITISVSPRRNSVEEEKEEEEIFLSFTDPPTRPKGGPPPLPEPTVIETVYSPMHHSHPLCCMICLGKHPLDTTPAFTFYDIIDLRIKLPTPKRNEIMPFAPPPCAFCPLLQGYEKLWNDLHGEMGEQYDKRTLYRMGEFQIVLNSTHHIEYLVNQNYARLEPQLIVDHLADRLRYMKGLVRRLANYNRTLHRSASSSSNSSSVTSSDTRPKKPPKPHSSIPNLTQSS